MTELKLYSMSDNPIETFINWYEQATKCEQSAEAMTLSTVGKSGRPNSRTVLYKGLKEGGLTFYTNYLSHKAQDLAFCPEACAVFYWHVCGRQVRVNGRVKRLSRQESVAYFQGRDKDSQLASYVSQQSAPMASKEELLQKFYAAKNEFQDTLVPTPEHWGGLVIEPYEIEFFVYGAHRLNDRFLFQKNEDSSIMEWKLTRLQP